MHKSRRPLDRLQYVFALWDPVTLQPQNHVTYYDIPRSFPTPSLNTFGSFVFELSYGQTHTHIQTQTQTDAGEYFTPATLNSMSKNRNIYLAG